MDLREVQPPPLQVLAPPQQTMLAGQPTSTYGANSVMMNPNPTASMIPQPSSTATRFTFGAIAQPQSQAQESWPTMGSMNPGGGFDGSQQPHYNVEPAAKRKRGRPRKYINDSNIVLQLAPTTPIPSASDNYSDSAGVRGNGGEAAPTTEPSAKRARGRPPGSGKKQLDALGGAGGVGFTPHVITVEAGEDIASKIMAFSQLGPRTVCILSANGVICSVTLRQPAMSGGTVTYEGMFEIVSLSGSFLLTEHNGNYSGTGGLSVSLAGSDGRVLGGGVAGMLRAASPVQVIVGSFIAGGKKQNPSVPKSGPSLLTPQVVNSRSAGASASTPSQDASSEYSEGNGSSSPDRGPGFCSNPASSLHNNSSPMYQLWSEVQNDNCSKL